MRQNAGDGHVTAQCAFTAFCASSPSGVQALVHSSAYFLLGDATVCGSSEMRAASWCLPVRSVLEMPTAAYPSLANHLMVARSYHR